HEPTSTEEQRLCRRLAVSAGEFDIAAAESICPGEDTPPEDVLLLVGQLLDKSLLSVGDQAGRYRVLETLRWFGAGHLIQAGEDPALRRRHSAYYRELAETAAEARAREGHAPWLQRLDAEHDNLRAALAWS